MGRSPHKLRCTSREYQQAPIFPATQKVPCEQRAGTDVQSGLSDLSVLCSTSVLHPTYLTATKSKHSFQPLSIPQNLGYKPSSLIINVSHSLGSTYHGCMFSIPSVPSRCSVGCSDQSGEQSACASQHRSQLRSPHMLTSRRSPNRRLLPSALPRSVPRPRDHPLRLLPADQRPRYGARRRQTGRTRPPMRAHPALAPLAREGAAAPCFVRLPLLPMGNSATLSAVSLGARTIPKTHVSNRAVHGRVAGTEGGPGHCVGALARVHIQRRGFT